jgi:low affinity Fe/Cu permease
VGEFFRGLARRVTLAAGSWQFFLIAIIGIGVWAITGPIFGFSDTWQLVINTSTTILTFLLGVLILLEANRQAKESKVVHEMSDEEVDKLEADLRARAGLRSTRSH